MKKLLFLLPMVTVLVIAMEEELPFLPKDVRNIIENLAVVNQFDVKKAVTKAISSADSIEDAVKNIHEIKKISPVWRKKWNEVVNTQAMFNYITDTIYDTWLDDWNKNYELPSSVRNKFSRNSTPVLIFSDLLLGTDSAVQELKDVHGEKATDVIMKWYASAKPEFKGTFEQMQSTYQKAFGRRFNLEK